MTSSFRPSLVAVFVVCATLAAPAHAQFDIFHRQAPPPANIPGGAPGDPRDAAGLVVRINQLEEELRQANGRIEELENAQHRLEAQLQKFRQDVEFRFGDRSGGAAAAGLRRRRSALGSRPAGCGSEAQTIGRVRSRCRSERARRAAAVGNDSAERPARARVSGAFGARAGRPWRSPRTRQRTPACPTAERTDGRRLRGRDARSAA